MASYPTCFIEKITISLTHIHIILKSHILHPPNSPSGSLISISSSNLTCSIHQTHHQSHPHPSHPQISPAPSTKLPIRLTHIHLILRSHLLHPPNSPSVSPNSISSSNLTCSIHQTHHQSHPHPSHPQISPAPSTKLPISLTHIHLILKSHLHLALQVLQPLLQPGVLLDQLLVVRPLTLKLVDHQGIGRLELLLHILW